MVSRRYSLHCICADFTNLTRILILAGLFVVLTDGVAIADTISGVTPMGQFTGDHLEDDGFGTVYNANACASQAVYGTDMGANYSVVINGQKYVRYLFGDTVSADSICTPGVSCLRTGIRRSAIVGYSNDLDASDGIGNLQFVFTPGNIYQTAKQVVPITGLTGTYPIAGWSVDGIEYIWATDFLALSPPTSSATRIYSSSDGWVHYRSTSAYLPRNRLSANYRYNFDMVTVGKLKVQGAEYLYFAGLPGSRVGDIQLMRIKTSDMANWANGTTAPEIYTTSNDWAKINSNIRPTAKTILSSVGEGSVAWIESIQKFMGLNMNYDFSRIEARFSSLPEGPWGEPIEVLVTDTCTGQNNGYSNALYRKAYGPSVLQEHVTTSGNSTIVYFLISRSNPGQFGGMFNTCTGAYDCASDTSSTDPCHTVYNTFLMKLTVQ